MAKNRRDLDVAWAAGVVDGEGAVTMLRAKPGVNRRKTLSFQIRVSVRMTHEPTLERLHRILGGVFKRGTAPRDPARHKQSYEWYVGDRLAELVLEELLGHLTTKHEQAALVLEFRRKCYPKHFGRNEVPKALVEKRLHYFERLTVLNRKGPT